MSPSRLRSAASERSLDDSLADPTAFGSSSAPDRVALMVSALAPTVTQCDVLFFGDIGHAPFPGDAADFVARWIRVGAVR